MTSKSTICFPFFCPTPFFYKTLNLFSIPLLSILSLFSTLLCPWNSSSIIFPLTDLLHFFPSIKISACQGTNCGSCMHRPFIMLPVASVVYHQFHMGIFLGILMITGMHQVVKPYILYIQFGACFSCWDSDYCAMSVSLHVHVNCVYDVTWAWLSVSAISVIITFAVLWDYFSQGMSRLIHHQLFFQLII